MPSRRVPPSPAPATTAPSAAPVAPDRPDSRIVRVQDRVTEKMSALPAVARVGTPTRRRAGVFRRALRHEIRRIQDPRRLTMMVLLGFAGGLVLAGLLARG